VTGEARQDARSAAQPGVGWDGMVGGLGLLGAPG
jgi:hypothetical protein